MPWGDNGVTNLRVAQDQAPTFSWSGGPVNVNFQAINDVGYLRKLWLKFPYSQQTLTLAATADFLAVPATLQMPAHRAIGTFRFIAQGIAAIYDLTLGGVDLALLSFMRSGRKNYNTSIIGTEGNVTTNTTSYGQTSDKYQYRSGVAVGSSGGTTQSIAYADTLEVPIIEHVYYPGGSFATQQGKSISLPQWAEVGLLTAQNTQQNLRLSATLNPLYTVSGGTANTVTTVTAAVPSTAYNGTLQLWTEFYDIPKMPADAPPAFTQSYVITRQSKDWTVPSTGAVTPKHDAAGLLLRVGYLFLDTNGGIVDISGQATDPTLSFRWGSNIYKENTIPFELMLSRMAELYGDAIPAGFLCFDFFGVDGPFAHTLTNAINTVELGSVYTEIKGLPSSVVTCHVIEERMVPVKG